MRSNASCKKALKADALVTKMERSIEVEKSTVSDYASYIVGLN
jgi:hypothetical protein